MCACAEGWGGGWWGAAAGRSTEYKVQRYPPQALFLLLPHALSPMLPLPQVNYREGISRTAEVRYVHKKQSGGSGQFADVAVRFEPGEPGTGFEFRSDIKGGVVPKEYIPGVTKVRSASLALW